jgi:hypothetical protein
MFDVETFIHMDIFVLFGIRIEDPGGEFLVNAHFFYLPSAGCDGGYEFVIYIVT